MITYPNAKINIGLYITGKLNNGYHTIESIFYPLYSTKDILEIIPSESFSFTYSGLEIQGEEKNNLCVKAFRLLQSYYQLPNVAIHLHKCIPMGAGLGGGSANGAFTLTMLNDLFALNISQAHLKFMAKSLGSDCPFFIENTPCYVSGVGDILKPICLDLETHNKIELAHSNVHISTQDAYNKFITPHLQKNINLNTLSEQNLHEWKEKITNGFEAKIFNHYPELKNTKEDFYNKGAKYVSMTGTGSTIYAIF